MTAYELRISDWSSDVCSSDLVYKDGQYLLNPTKAELVDSKLELVVAGTANAVLMVESKAQELSEDVMLGAVMFGHHQMQVAINTINELVAEAGKPKWTWAAPAADANMVAALKTAIGDRLNEAFSVRDKLERKEIGRAHAELQSLMRNSYAVFCLKNKNERHTPTA